MAILSKECRSKIAELSGKAETLTRTEGCNVITEQSGAERRSEETIISQEAAASSLVDEKVRQSCRKKTARICG